MKSKLWSVLSILILFESLKRVKLVQEHNTTLLQETRWNIMQQKLPGSTEKCMFVPCVFDLCSIVLCGIVHASVVGYFLSTHLPATHLPEQL